MSEPATSLRPPQTPDIARAAGHRDMLDLALTVSGIIGIWDGDLITGQVYGDANFARIYGIDPAEAAAGKPLGYYFELMNEQDLAGAEAARARMMAGADDYAHEHRIIRRDGSLLWVSARGRLLRDDAGRPCRFIGVSVDITARRLAEARQAFLLELQDSLRGLSEPADILTAAACLLGRHLSAARISFGELQADDETLLITNAYADGAPELNGRFPLKVFGPYHVSQLLQGRTVVYEDARAGAAGGGGFAQLGTGGHVTVPRMRNGRYAGSLCVTYLKPYKWTAQDIALIEDVAGRIWDAAERGRTEVKLRESEERLRLVMDATGLGFWEYDAGTGVTIRSARHDEIFGYAAPVSDWSYEIFLTHIPPADQARVEAGFRAALEHGRDWDVECRMVRADGRQGWLKVLGRPHYGADGKIARLLGTVADITERKQAEEAAFETAAQFEMFAQTMPSMVWTSLPDGRIEWFNARVSEYCGMPAGELKPDGWAPVHPDDVATASRLWLEAIASGTRYVAEYRIRRHDGEYRWHITRAVPIRDADGVIIRWIGTSTDIQDRKNSEQALSELNATLEQQVRERTTELMAAEATLRQSQKMEAVGQLTGGLAHDFNNLLAGISGSLELLEKHLAQGRVNELGRYVQIAKGAAQRAAALTHRLLAFSRRQTLDPKPTDINALVHEMDELIRRTVSPAVAVHVVGAPELWPVLVDPHQLENALLNLCINAADAMPDGGNLTIATRNCTLSLPEADALELQAGPYVLLSVADTGTGMTEDVIACAFDPFFTTKPMGEGTGLGLSMVYGFVRQSGGQARIHSEAGAGTTVSLYLPRSFDENAICTSPTQPEPAHRGNGETVLVVDDEPTVRMLVAEVLADLGYEALESGEGASALKILQSGRRVDLLVTDVGLPGGMNGRQLADAARIALPDLKILFITGYAETAVVGASHLNPGMHIVTKPFSMETLSQRISEIFAARGA